MSKSLGQVNAEAHRDENEEFLRALAREVTPLEHRRWRLKTVLPQVGGYSSACDVTFGPSCSNDGSLGCVDVAIRHDGEFPRPRVVAELHFCDALQIVRFGLDVLEAQVKHETTSDGSKSWIDKGRVRDLGDRLLALCADDEASE